MSGVAIELMPDVVVVAGREIWQVAQLFETLSLFNKGPVDTVDNNVPCWKITTIASM